MLDEAARLQLEGEAEVLAAHQLDLVAQIEAQLRAVRSLMVRINRLRPHQPGELKIPLPDGHHAPTLEGLRGELAAIEQQLGTQQESCTAMHATIARMQRHLPALKDGAREIGPEQ